MAKQYSNTFFSSLSKSSQNLSKFENCSFQKLKQLKHESKNQMTKNQKIIEDILTNQESTATATISNLSNQIRKNANGTQLGTSHLIQLLEITLVFTEKMWMQQDTC
jgi:hypothetical protein